MAKKKITVNMESTVKATKLSEVPILETKTLDLSLIDFNPLNAHGRHDTPEMIDELAKELKEVGLVHNIVVYPYKNDNGEDRYMLVSGERRTKAYKKMLMPTINASIIKKPAKRSDEFKLIISANEAVRKSTVEEKLNLISEYKDLVESELKNGSFDDYDATELKAYIVDAFGVSERQADKYILINDALSPELTEMLKEEKIDINLASSIAALSEQGQNYSLSILQSDEIKTEEDFDIAKKLTANFAKEVKKATRAHTSNSAKTGIEYREKTLPVLKSDLKKEEAQLSELKRELENIPESEQDYIDKKTEIAEKEKNVEKINAKIIKGEKELLRYKEEVASNYRKIEDATQELYNIATATLKNKGIEPANKDDDSNANTPNYEELLAKEIKKASNAINNLVYLIATNENMVDSIDCEDVDDMLDKLKAIAKQCKTK